MTKTDQEPLTAEELATIREWVASDDPRPLLMSRAEAGRILATIDAMTPSHSVEAVPGLRTALAKAVEDMRGATAFTGREYTDDLVIRRHVLALIEQVRPEPQPEGEGGLLREALKILIEQVEQSDAEFDHADLDAARAALSRSTP